MGSEHCTTDSDIRVGADRYGGGAVDDHGELDLSSTAIFFLDRLL